MRKIILLWICILILPIVFSQESIFDGNVVYVNTSKGMIAQDPHTIESGEEAVLIFENRANISSFIACMRMPPDMSIDDVEFTLAKKVKWWWFDEDLNDVTKVNNQIKCIQSFENEKEVTIRFKVNYEGPGTVKYDILAFPSSYGATESGLLNAFNNGHMIILDPYLVGSLGTEANTLLHFPFQNSLVDTSLKYNIIQKNDTAQASTITTGTQLIRVTNVTDHAPQNIVRNYTGSFLYTGSFEYDVDIQFDYGSGYIITTPTQHVSANNTILVFANPRPNLPVNVMNTRMILTGANQIERNNSINLSKNNTFTYYLVDNNSSHGYNYKVNKNSSDVFNNNNSIDINVSYGNQGLVLNGSDTAISGVNTTLTTGFMDNAFTFCTRFSMATKNHGGDLIGNFHSSTGGCMQLYVFGSQRLIWHCNNGVTTAITLGDINLNQSYMMCSGRDTTNNNLWASLDNQTRITGADLDNLGSVSNNHNVIVGYEFSFPRVWNGTIREAYVYNTSLSEQQVISLFKSGNYTANAVDESNTAINFSGNDYILVENDYLYNFTVINRTTQAFWMKPTDVTTEQFPLSFGNDMYFRLETGTMHFNILTLGDVATTGNLKANQWTHIASRYNGAEVTIWVNGVKNNTLFVSSTFSSSDNLQIGARNQSSFFTGGIDDVMIFSKSLSNSEMLQLAGGFNNSINYTIRDAETDAIITENVTIEVFNADGSYSRVIYTNTGEAFINGIPPNQIISSSLYSDLYSVTTIATDVTTENTNYNQTVYLLNKTGVNAGKLFTFVFNTDYYAIKNADTRLQQYFPETGEFVEVQQCYSNSNGECVFNIVIGTVRYIVTATATINNITSTGKSSTNGNFFPLDNTELEIYLNFQDTYTVPDDFGLIVNAFNETLDGNTSNLYGDFIDINGNVHEVCRAFYYLDGFDRIIADEVCTNGSSGTVGFGSSVLLNRTFTWTAELYTKVDGNKFKTYESFRYPKVKSFSQEFNEYLNPLIILIMAILLGFSLQLKNISLFSIGMIPATLIYGFLKPTVFTPVIVGTIIVMCILLIYVGRKKADTEGT